MKTAHKACLVALVQMFAGYGLQVAHAEVAAGNVQLIVDPQARARLAAEQRNANQTAASVAGGWHRLIEAWKRADQAPNSAAQARALSSALDVIEAQHAAIDRYETQILQLRERYVRVLAESGVRQPTSRPALAEIGPDLGGFAAPFAEHMPAQQQRLIQSRIALQQMSERMNQVVAQTLSSSAMATRGDYFGAVRLLDESILTIQAQRQALRMHSSLIMARAEWDTAKSAALAPIDTDTAIEASSIATRAVMRFMDTEPPIEQTATGGAFDGLLR